MPEVIERHQESAADCRKAGDTACRATSAVPSKNKKSGIVLSARAAWDAGFLPHEGTSGPRAATSRRRLSVKTSLRGAFGIVLAGTLAIGAIAVTQLSRLHGATELIYEQGVVASRAAEETRGYVLRASRSQKMLLTAKERDDLGTQIDQALAGIGRERADLVRHIDTGDAAAIAQQQRFSAALGKWSDNLRTFVKFVKDQPLDLLLQMNWQVSTQDISLLVETGKLEKMVDELVTQRSAAAKSTIDAAAFISSARRPR